MLLLVALTILTSLIPAAAGAQEDGEESPGETTASLGGTLEDVDDEPVEGVAITVVAEDGTEVGSAESDAAGEWRVPVPEAGSYEVTIDIDTLPEEVVLRDPDRASLTPSVRAGQDKAVIFALTDADGGAAAGVSRFDRLSNLAAEGVKFGLMVALAALGLSMVFGITGLVNFAHGELLAFGAIVSFWLERGAGPLPAMPLLLAGAIAIVGSGALGALFEKGVFAPVRRRGSGTIAAMVISIGLAILVRHLYLVFFGSRPDFYLDFRLQSTYELGPIALTPKSWATIVVGAVVLLAVGWALRTTRTGRAMRAVSVNKDLAESSGIDVGRVITATWIVGAALAGLSGVLFGLSESVRWDMGNDVLLLMFAAVVLGGLGTAYGAMFGGLVVGLVTQMSTYWFAAELKLMFALIVLVVVLVARPRGILGVKERFG